MAIKAEDVPTEEQGIPEEELQHMGKGDHDSGEES